VLRLPDYLRFMQVVQYPDFTAELHFDFTERLDCLQIWSVFVGPYPGAVRFDIEQDVVVLFDGRPDEDHMMMMSDFQYEIESATWTPSRKRALNELRVELMRNRPRIFPTPDPSPPLTPNRTPPPSDDEGGW
jgi:hypothetical protein